MSNKIKSVFAREILDSRGNPTVEATVELAGGTTGAAAMPSGASTGKFEAVELRDGDAKRYGGKGVLKAVANVTDIIAPKVIGMDASEQSTIDKLMLELDGTEQKSRLGANAILGVSMAVARAAATTQHQPLHKYLNGLVGSGIKPKLPRPMVNVLNGGRHAEGGADIQDTMLIPRSPATFKESLRLCSEIFHSLGKLLKGQGQAVTVGDEGGYAPGVASNQELLELLAQATEQAGYKLGEDVVFALDVAASELFEDGHYRLKTDSQELSSQQMVEWLTDLRQRFPLFSIEDGLDQEDWDTWANLTKNLGESTMLVTDDLTVTNPARLGKAISQKAGNAILVKLNQIGTVSETLEAIAMARQSGWPTVISHRSGETEDNFIAHLAVASASPFIKSGSTSRSERLAKYNELMRIEEVDGLKLTEWIDRG